LALQSVAGVPTIGLVVGHRESSDGAVTLTGALPMFPIRDGVATRYAPVITWCLIASNCAVFLAQLSLTPAELEWFLARFALIPARYFHAMAGIAPAQSLADYLPFVTNMFLHGGWLHLIVNMWTLWIFGAAVEDRLGAVTYLVFYLATGIAASIAHAVFNPDSVVPALGASGAIAGVIGCYVRLFPLARLLVVVPILFIPLFFEVPAIFFAGFWFLMQLLQGSFELLAPSDGAGVAWWAHVGGFIAGLLLTPVVRRPVRSYRTYYGDEGIYGLTPLGRR
jgi:membrane associated rhomboid family serine protease